MATSLVECSLAQLYKRKEGDEFRGGPARTIIHGLGEDYRWLAYLYAVCLIASFAIGFNAFQGNTVAGAAQDSMGIDRIWTGALLALGTGFIIYGGIKRIAKVADVIVPIMAIGYVAMALLIILMNITSIPAVIGTIVSNAFGWEEAVGGGMGLQWHKACAEAYSLTKRAWARLLMLPLRQKFLIQLARGSRSRCRCLSIPSLFVAARHL